MNHACIYIPYVRCIGISQKIRKKQRYNGKINIFLKTKKNKKGLVSAEVHDNELQFTEKKRGSILPRKHVCK